MPRNIPATRVFLPATRPSVTITAPGPVPQPVRNGIHPICGFFGMPDALVSMPMVHCGRSSSTDGTIDAHGDRMAA
jgi:hypothetical protein